MALIEAYCAFDADGWTFSIILVKVWADHRYVSIVSNTTYS